MPNRASGFTWDADGEPPRRIPPRRLSPEVIVASAMSLADGKGLSSVTIRAVAAALDVRPMSLYTHIASKGDLLDLMANEVIGRMLVRQLPAGQWREALAEIARRSHAAFVAHPWALEAFGRRPRLGPNAVRHATQMARALEGTDLPPQEVWTVLGIVDDYVLGHALRVPTTGNARDLQGASGRELADVPELAALLTVNDGRSSRESFEIGLQTVLDGIEHRFLSATRPLEAVPDAQAATPSPLVATDGANGSADGAAE